MSRCTIFSHQYQSRRPGHCSEVQYWPQHWSIQAYLILDILLSVWPLQVMEWGRSSTCNGSQETIKATMAIITIMRDFFICFTIIHNTHGFFGLQYFRYPKTIFFPNERCSVMTCNGKSGIKHCTATIFLSSALLKNTCQPFFFSPYVDLIVPHGKPDCKKKS